MRIVNVFVFTAFERVCTATHAFGRCVRAIRSPHPPQVEAARTLMLVRTALPYLAQQEFDTAGFSLHLSLSEKVVILSFPFAKKDR